MTASANGYQVILYTLLSEAFVAIRAVVDLERVTRAILITQAAFMAVYRKAGVTLGFPSGRSHVAFIVAFVHRVLNCAGSLPCQARPRQARPVRAAPRPTAPRPTHPNQAKLNLAPFRHALPCNWSPVSGGGSLPCQTPPRRASPDLARPHRAVPYRTAPCPETKKSACLPAHMVALAEGRAREMADRQANACEHENSGSNVLQHSQYITPSIECQ